MGLFEAYYYDELPRGVRIAFGITFGILFTALMGFTIFAGSSLLYETIKILFS